MNQEERKHRSQNNTIPVYRQSQCQGLLQAFMESAGWALLSSLCDD